MSPFQKVIAPQFLNVIETLRRVTAEVRGAPLAAAAAARIKASCFGLLQKRSRENKERGRESRPSKCHRREREEAEEEGGRHWIAKITAEEEEEDREEEGHSRVALQIGRAVMG